MLKKLNRIDLAACRFYILGDTLLCCEIYNITITEEKSHSVLRRIQKLEGQQMELSVTNICLASLHELIWNICTIWALSAQPLNILNISVDPKYTKNVDEALNSR